MIAQLARGAGLVAVMLAFLAGPPARAQTDSQATTTQSVEGRITKVDALDRELHLLDQSNRFVLAVKVTKDSRILRNNEPSSLGKLQQGESARVSYDLLGDEMVARRVEVFPGQPAERHEDPARRSPGLGGSGGGLERGGSGVLTPSDSSKGELPQQGSAADDPGRETQRGVGGSGNDSLAPCPPGTRPGPSVDVEGENRDLDRSRGPVNGQRCVPAE